MRPYYELYVFPIKSKKEAKISRDYPFKKPLNNDDSVNTDTGVLIMSGSKESDREWWL
jgi:hypothetical protein